MKIRQLPFLGLLLILTFILLIAGCSVAQTENTKSVVRSIGASYQQTPQEVKGEESTDFKVHFLDVGQGDSVLIQSGSQLMLIDGGNNTGEKELVQYLKGQGIKKIDYLIATHPHEDHIGGLDKVIKNFDIGKIIMPKVSHTTKTFEDVLLAVKKKGLKITAPKPGDTFLLGKAICTILSPERTKYKDLNNYSVVLHLQYEEFSFLFTGDAESLVEKEIMSKDANISANVLKVGHHGSSTSTSADFLAQINPQFAVISVGKANDYGHPHQETMARLKKQGVTVYRTDESGTITVQIGQGKLRFNH